MSWTLHLGDCLDPVTGMASLADKSVDHVITDPPYSRDLYLKFRTNKGAGKRSPGGDGVERFRISETAAHLALANMAIGAVDDVWEKCGPHILRAARRWIVIFHDVESGHMWRTAMGDSYIRAGAWVKTDAVPQISGDRPGTGIEAITIAHREGRKRWNGGGRPAVWSGCSARTDDRSEHPCPKPAWLMEKLVRDFTDPSETILDPFAGSGTTGVAAIRLGRKFIGWERDPKYHAIAMKRLNAAREQLEFAS
jgi:site-specific DNA-methyltransferase (adenine-specific)